MKKAMIFVLVGILVLAVGSALAGVANTKHNLTSGNATSTHTSDTNATLCGFCHIPHGGNTNVSGAPLWARSLAGASYTLYSSLATNKTLSNTTVDTPGANSLTCLSCHDGTIGIGVTQKYGINATNYPMVAVGTDVTLDADGSFATPPGTAFYRPNLTTDLRDDHPVGVQYIAGGMAGLGSIASVTAANYRLYGNAGSEKVECGSCHDPHTENYKFKRTVTATDFCVGCHSAK